MIKDMTLKEFEARHQELFDKGVIQFLDKHPIDNHIDATIPNANSKIFSNQTLVKVDRQVNGEWLAEIKEVQLPISHLKQMGFTRQFGAIGVYGKWNY